MTASRADAQPQAERSALPCTCGRHQRKARQLVQPERNQRGGEEALPPVDDVEAVVCSVLVQDHRATTIPVVFAVLVSPHRGVHVAEQLGDALGGLATRPLVAGDARLEGQHVDPARYPGGYGSPSAGTLFSSQRSENTTWRFDSARTWTALCTTGSRDAPSWTG